MKRPMTNERMLYDGHITADPTIMVGKPVIKGTRIPVELVLEELAHNPAVDELLAAHPGLTTDDVKACLAYATAMVKGEEVSRRRCGRLGLIRSVYEVPLRPERRLPLDRASHQPGP